MKSYLMQIMHFFPWITAGLHEMKSYLAQIMHFSYNNWKFKKSLLKILHLLAATSTGSLNRMNFLFGTPSKNRVEIQVKKRLQ